MVVTDGGGCDNMMIVTDGGGCDDDSDRPSLRLLTRFGQVDGALVQSHHDAVDGQLNSRGRTICEYPHIRLHRQGGGL